MKADKANKIVTKNMMIAFDEFYMSMGMKWVQVLVNKMSRFSMYD